MTPNDRLRAVLYQYKLQHDNAAVVMMGHQCQCELCAQARPLLCDPLPLPLPECTRELWASYWAPVAPEGVAV